MKAFALLFIESEFMKNISFGELIEFFAQRPNIICKLFKLMANANFPGKELDIE